MKRITILIALAMLLLPLVLVAQQGKNDCAMGGGQMAGMHAGKGMMGRGMGMSMRGMGNCGGPGGLMQLADQLQLTDQQRDKLKAMMTDHQVQNIDRRAALQKAEIKLTSSMRDQAPTAEVNRAIDEVSRLRAELQKANYAHRSAMKGVLTADQVKKFDELRKDCCKDGLGGMRGCRHGMAPMAPGTDDDDAEDGH